MQLFPGGGDGESSAQYTKFAQKVDAYFKTERGKENVGFAGTEEVYFYFLFCLLPFILLHIIIILILILIIVIIIIIIIIISCLFRAK